MAHWRAYIRRKITQDDQGRSVGGDHTRVIDLEVEGSPKAEIDRQLEADEEIDQIVTLTVDNPIDQHAVAIHYGGHPDG